MTDRRLRSLIARKRDGGRWTSEEVDAFVAGVVSGELTDGQLGAGLMAGYLRGFDREEIVALTRAMRDSGTVLRSRRAGIPKVDKHSTGGVGDKVTLVLAPIVASCGAWVPTLTGRGLGHTGGTLDKLESIPGFVSEPDLATLGSWLEEGGLVFGAATPEIAPADRRMYRMRDETETVACLGWIVSSILSKKLAEDLDALVLDVKCGRGAFLQDRARARELAELLVDTAAGLGVAVRARSTAMDEPLGNAVGNALEVAEAVETLRGGGPEELRELALVLAADLLELGGLAAHRDDARARARRALESGDALVAFQRAIARQGGDARVCEDPWRVLPKAPERRPLLAERDGWVASVDALSIALAAHELGAGRQRAGEAIDPRVGVVCLVHRGDRVERGAPLAEIHAAGPDAASTALPRVQAAIEIDERPVAPADLLLDVIDPHPGGRAAR